MREWGAQFTCIAPDTPGFGQSDPLLLDEPDIGDFADALVAFMAALGLERTAAYGFHSGGIILVTAMKRHPNVFSRLAIGGYAVWTPEEMALFGEAYLPPFRPSVYGEHLTWLWNRILEQSWFFPWFDVRDEARLAVAHDDPERVHAVVMDMLDAGNAYRAGYGAVLRAPRDIPPPDAITPPVLITAYDGDPLQPHIDRLGDMPTSWEAYRVASPDVHRQSSLSFLLRDGDVPSPPIAEDREAGFAHIKTDAFDGLIHWDGDMVDPPGHGLSDPWPGDAPVDWKSWADVFDAFEAATGQRVALLPLPKGDPDRLYPLLVPDRFGTYLTTAWSVARARELFDPWYDVSPTTAIPVNAARLTPEVLARSARDILRARSARALHIAREGKG